MTLFEALLGLPSRTHLITGIEDDPDESDRMRVYIDARYLNRFVLVDTAQGEALRARWGAFHTFVDLPEDATIYQERSSE